MEKRIQISNSQILIANYLAPFISQLIHYFVIKLLTLKYLQRERYILNVPVMEENIRFDISKLPFEVSIGDDLNWSTWVQTNKLRVWEQDPGDQVDSSLIGNDVLDQLTYVHQKGEEFLFLNTQHENQLAEFLNNLSP